MVESPVGRAKNHILYELFSGRSRSRSRGRSGRLRGGRGRAVVVVVGCTVGVGRRMVVSIAKSCIGLVDIRKLVRIRVHE